MLFTTEKSWFAPNTYVYFNKSLTKCYFFLNNPQESDPSLQQCGYNVTVHT